MAFLSLAVLYLNVHARAASSGAGGCGNFIDAVALVEDGDIVTPMVPPRNSEGAVISKNIIIQGGWSPPQNGCDVANQVFTTTADMLTAGFTFDAPGARSGLFFFDQPVLTIDPQVNNLTIQHISFEQQGTLTQKGGGISGVINNGAVVRFENIVFTNSTTLSQGGGLYLEVRGGSRLVISDSLFYGNKSGSGGGFEIRVYDNSKVIIHNTQVISNEATTGNGGGGLILIDTGVVTITDSVFKSNLAFQSLSGQASGPNGLTIQSLGSGPAKVTLLNSDVQDGIRKLGNGLIVFDKQVLLPYLGKNWPPRSFISGITLNGSTYVVNFQTYGFTPQLPGQHVHFFFNTVPPANAGVPGPGPWQVYGGSSPFTGYTTADRPVGATQLCILVANPDHSVQLGTGNCYPLP
jgi:hypothetical protein